MKANVQEDKKMNERQTQVPAESEELTVRKGGKEGRKGTQREGWPAMSRGKKGIFPLSLSFIKP